MFIIPIPENFYAIDHKNHITYYVGGTDQEWRYLPATFWDATTQKAPRNPQDLLKIDDQHRALVNRIYHQNYRLMIEHDIMNELGEVSHWRVVIALISWRQVEKFIVRKDALSDIVWLGLHEYGAGDTFTITADTIVLSRTDKSDQYLVDNCVIRCGSEYVVGLGPHKILRTQTECNGTGTWDVSDERRELTESLHELRRLATSSGMSEQAFSNKLCCHINWKTVDTSILGLTISLGHTVETFSGVLLQDAKDLIGADKVTHALESFPSQRGSSDGCLDMTVVRPEHRKVHEMMNPLILELYKHQRMLYDAEEDGEEMGEHDDEGDDLRDKIRTFNQQIVQINQKHGFELDMCIVPNFTDLLPIKDFDCLEACWKDISDPHNQVLKHQTWLRSNIPHSWIILGCEKLEQTSGIRSYPYRFEKPADFIYQKNRHPLTTKRIRPNFGEIKLIEVSWRRNGEELGYIEDWVFDIFEILTEEIKVWLDEALEQWTIFRHNLDLDKAIAGTEKPDPLWLRYYLGTWTDAEGNEVEYVSDSDS